MPHLFYVTRTRALYLAVLGLAMAVAMSLATLNPAHAQEPTPTPVPDVASGVPSIPPDGAAGYYIWHDEAGWHLRTHGPGAEHDFTARIHTDGVFADVDGVRLESGDSVTVIDGGHTILMRVHTYDGIDGVNFRVAHGDELRFRLELDGSLISTGQIYLGSLQHHPATNPFTLKLEADRSAS